MITVPIFVLCLSFESMCLYLEENVKWDSNLFWKNLDLGFLFWLNILLWDKEPENLDVIEFNGLKYILIDS